MASGRDRSELPTLEFQSSARKLGRIGPYRLLAELGEGGMGVVYEALQARPLRRRVALKLIRRGMDSERVVGFRPVRSHEVLPDQFFVEYEPR